MDGFKPMKGYEGYYINEVGDVYSVKYGGFLKQRIDKQGYYYIRLGIANKKITKKVHRLVAENFLPEAHTMETVNHKNFIKTDNRVENLEWATNLENIDHYVRSGRRVGGGKPRPFGDTKTCSKCSIEKKMDEFGVGRGVGGHNSWCLECEKTRQKEYYIKNRGKFLNAYHPKRRYNSKFAKVDSKNFSENFL